MCDLGVCVMSFVTSLPRRTAWTGIALAVAGAMAFSGKAILAKLMYRHGVDAVTVVAWRMLMSLPLFALMAIWAGRGKPPLTRQDVIASAGLGFCGYYASSMLDFYGLMYISASLERLILYLGPTLVMGLSVVWFKRPVRRRQWAAAALSYTGAMAVFGHELGHQGPQVALGAALVFASAVTYAIYQLACGEVVKRLGSLRLTGLASSAACVWCLLHFVLVKPLGALVVPTPVLALSALNAVACTVVAVLLVMMAIERIGPTLNAQISMIGPISTIGLGVWVLDEPFTPWLLLGTALVLTGVTLATRWR
ncbi:multidrug DMT transporter permease (plasmid) [Vitreoscilla filiformis]|uniref:Multidrug DMT transporter permease n=2 Tax=Vitreoscilla filiformis TaxID=63 RepID=A0A221KK31_VITFI|nr:multidrug DMT transporter permease [Vitreoscilla filiformis]